MTYIFHGTNAELLDEGLVAGTYFTEDLEIAMKYGDTIYAIDYGEQRIHFSKDEEGYFVSHCFIPLEYFKVLEVIQ